MVTINFANWIYDSDVGRNKELQGPVFTRWLPNGEDDALKVVISEHNATVYLWFEQHGTMDDNGFIKYEHKKNEIDKNVIPNQSKLYAGALYGKIVLNNVSEENKKVLINNESNAKEYIKLGKTVIQRILDPVLCRFTKILKNTYGQYWISIHRKYDSRIRPLANHCNRLNMKWFIEGQSGEFLPGSKVNEVVAFTSSFCNENDYIGKDLWFRIEGLLVEEFEPSVSSAIASRSNRLLSEGRYSHSLIEAVTAIELSIEEHVRIVLKNSPNLEGYMESFWRNPLPTRVSLVAGLAGANQKDISLSITGIQQRNLFVHEGKEPDVSVKDLVRGLLRIISYLNSDQQLMYPGGSSANSLSKAENE